MLVQLFLNACLTGTRMAAPLQALRLGHGETAVGFLIALFALAGSLIGAAGVFWAAGLMAGAGARLALGFKQR